MLLVSDKCLWNKAFRAFISSETPQTFSFMMEAHVLSNKHILQKVTSLWKLPEHFITDQYLKSIMNQNMRAAAFLCSLTAEEIPSRSVMLRLINNDY